ncbi:TPA: hypothetical protein ACH3X1_002062 [Trebouxia sp. C0004]
MPIILFRHSYSYICWIDCSCVPALQGQGAPDVEPHANIPLKKLPHDSKGHLLHPGVVW